MQPDGRPHPIFVGGTGRSGTTVLARLIGSHREYSLIPFEARFHAEADGLRGLDSGRVTLEQFLESMRSKWGWREERGERVPKRLRRMLSAEALETALVEFERSYVGAPLDASRRLVGALLDPLAREAGASRWVEMTPPNVSAGNWLRELFPDMRLIHIVRDGRDVAFSVARVRERTLARGIGTARRSKTPLDLMRSRWDVRLRRSAEGSSALPPDQLLVLQFEDLLLHDRDASYARLLRFLSLEDDPGMRAYFDETMTPDRAHVGRWREGLSEEDAGAVDRLYAELLEALWSDGVACAPARTTLR